MLGFRAQTHTQEALGLYATAISLDPLNNVLFANRSAIYSKLRRFAEAAADARCSIDINPDWAKVRRGWTGPICTHIYTSHVHARTLETFTSRIIAQVVHAARTNTCENKL
jgi:tetratricopeptide (TPR) repeat protein